MCAHRAERLPQNEQPLSDFEAKLINRLQENLPLCETPYQQLAEELGSEEALVLETLESLLQRQVLTRFGPLFDIARRGGAFSLCALQVPEARLESVATIVNAYPQVAHNYLREHTFNMWFVLATPQADEIDRLFDEICRVTQCFGINCPKQKEFFVGLFLPAEARVQHDAQ